ncbi:hypothetical protein DFH09DRAFT_1456486 [Mycena vulgaris]|nr:hypothetical protein DFH09DRAFT_1456486 [Mycena vulgaris]
MTAYSVRRAGFPSAITKDILAAEEREMKRVRREFDVIDRRDAAKREKALPPEPVADSPRSTGASLPDNMWWMAERTREGVPTPEPSPIFTDDGFTDGFSDESDDSDELWFMRAKPERAPTPGPVSENHLSAQYRMGSDKPPSAEYSLPQNKPWMPQQQRRAQTPTPDNARPPTVVPPVDKSRSPEIRPDLRLRDMTWINKLFPTILQPALIRSIVLNKLPGIDLARLNPRRSWEGFEKGCSLRDYPTVQSLVMPLSVYFRVLQTWVAKAGDPQATRVVGEAYMRYNAHLLELSETYQWPAVVEYHMQFHEKRRIDMTKGDYGNWAVGDRELINRLLVSREQNSPTKGRPGVISW